MTEITKETCHHGVRFDSLDSCAGCVAMFKQPDYHELLIGAGSNHKKKIYLKDHPEAFSDLTTLDMEESHHTDILWDLNHLPLPFQDGYFAEIHAYEVLEHLSTQGNYKEFFALWEELWRILRPNGLVVGSSPKLDSRWLWGDPGHTRAVTPESFVFLQQPEYTRQVGKTPMSDYRAYFKGDFDLIVTYDHAESFFFVLRAVKPSRITS